MQVVTRIFALCVEFTDAQGFFNAERTNSGIVSGVYTVTCYRRMGG